MDIDKLKFPGEGLIKTAPPKTAALSREKRSALIRKGNELYNSGNIEQAKRVFLTVHYTDGLIRIGDHYYKQNRFLQALQMYIIAPENRKREQIVEKMSRIVQNWLAES
ncbi:hypothetical protein [Salinispira pacifica]|uniref:Uncharacterized protein n=1 Tax=Salinispira pacifica TaxID=1307761 RepID=V5WFP4_9SPIO|nr:hypothetical protein [Salinispira pacifica]AHC14455.1 hypothetical protein L21SP2_1039 [Salinispira pacifica]